MRYVICEHCENHQLVYWGSFLGNGAKKCDKCKEMIRFDSCKFDGDVFDL
jgi:phage FluMu protein Com